MKKSSLSALVAAGLLMGGLSAGSASAADLGGNCCADLEERIAELEATTARKGNRKVSLTISGWVGEQVMYWDNDNPEPLFNESNTYVTASAPRCFEPLQVHRSGHDLSWLVGGLRHPRRSRSLATSLTHNESLAAQWSCSVRHRPNPWSPSFGRAVQALQSYWFIKSDHLGKFGVGLQSQASDNTAILVDGSGSLVPANWVMFDYAASCSCQAAHDLGLTGSSRRLLLRWAARSATASASAKTSIRYDSPTFHGFSISASWGEDDFWDVAARYSGEFNGFKLAVAAAYNDVSSRAVTDSRLAS